MTDYLNPSRIYPDKKCVNPQKLIEEINARLDEIGIKPGEDCTDYSEEADNG